MVVSSVSPERWLMTLVQPASEDMRTAARVSVKGAYLVQLDEHGVGGMGVDAAPDALGVGGEQVVADELHPAAEPCCEGTPALPVVLGHAVLDAYDGEVRAQSFPEGDHLLRVERYTLPRQDVLAVVEELGGRRVEGEEDIDARAVPRRRDGLMHDLQRLPVGQRRRREATLIADVRAVATGAQQPLQGLVDLGAGAEGVGEVADAGGGDHEFLDVRGVLGVLTAVQDVEHRHRQRDARAKVAVEGHACGRGGGVGNGKGDAEDGVGPHGRFVRRTIGVQHAVVHGLLVVGGEADHRQSQPPVHVCHRRTHARAGKPGLVAVTELDGLVAASACARGDGGSAEDAVRQAHVDLDGGVTTRVEDLAGVHFCNRRRHTACLAFATAIAFSTASTGESALTIAVSSTPSILNCHVFKPITVAPSPSASPISDSVP